MPLPFPARWNPLVAFLGHMPGLLLVGHPLDPQIKRQNAIAVAATLVAMGASWWLAPGGRPGLAVLVVWLFGHFAWSSWLAWWVYRGRASEEG